MVVPRMVACQLTIRLYSHTIRISIRIITLESRSEPVKMASSITKSYSTFIYNSACDLVDHAYVAEIPEKGWATLSADDIPVVKTFISIKTPDQATPLYAKSPVFMGEKYIYVNNVDGVFVLKKGDIMVFFAHAGDKTIISIASRNAQADCIAQINALKETLA